MSDNEEVKPTEAYPPTGRYPVDEHLHAQNAQNSPATGQPLNPAGLADSVSGTAEAEESNGQHSTGQ